MTAVPGLARMPRRTDKVIDAIVAELEMRRGMLNADATIRSITVVVKMRNGSDEPRAVLVTVETERTLSC